ncbi:MAG: phosphate ABC transporter substrate-binding protein PstS [Candidatus Acidiferrum sp.]
MRNSRPSAPILQSSSHDLVVRIDKRAALLLLAGVAAIAAVFVYKARETEDRNKVQAEISAPNNASTTLPAPDDIPPATPATHEPRSVTPPPSAVETAPPADMRNSDQDVDRSGMAPPPATAVTESQEIVTSYPSLHAPPDPPPADSPSPDNLPSDSPFAPGPSSNPSPAPQPPGEPRDSIASALLNGAGATFPYPLYSKWFDEFHKLHPEVQFNYQSVGSGAGIRQLLENNVEFAATDVPMNDQQLAGAKIPILHVPSVLGAVVPIYNVPGVRELRFTPEILAGIYSGKLTYWNDREIVAANPRANLLFLPISVIHRSDGCATTFIFTDYLSKVSAEWQHAVGKGTSVNWPLGVGGKGNEGIAGLLKQTPGAIGYVDFQYAVQSQIPFGSVRNSRNRFIKADLASLTAAAVLPDAATDFRLSITNASGFDAYPISSFTWFLVPVRSRHGSEDRDLAAFLRWMLASRSQDIAGSLGYAPLPEQLARRVNEEISKIH